MVSLYVAPCNDPPVAHNVSGFVYAATRTRLDLNATDVDNQPASAKATITRLPVNGGSLIQFDPLLVRKI